MLDFAIVIMTITGFNAGKKIMSIVILQILDYLSRRNIIKSYKRLDAVSVLLILQTAEKGYCK